MRKDWYVVRAQHIALGLPVHFRAVAESHRPNRHEEFVDLVPRTYEDASRYADELNTVEEVMGS